MGIQNWSDDILLLTLAEEPQMGEELATALELVSVKGEKNVVVDFSNVEVVTSSSLAKLLRLKKALVKNNRNLVLCGLNIRTKSIFMITGLDMVFDFVQDQFMALAGIQMVNSLAGE